MHVRAAVFAYTASYAAVSLSDVLVPRTRTATSPMPSTTVSSSFGKGLPLPSGRVRTHTATSPMPGSASDFSFG